MTIPAEKLDAVRKIVSHADCPDGVASALILRDVLPEAEIVFARYGTKELEEMPATPGMLFVDFSPPAGRAQEFVDAGAIVLDHHRTAEAVVRAFGDLGVYSDEPGVSGAMLAYREVWRHIAPDIYGPNNINCERAVFLFATVVGVRDTWQRKSPMWREACAQAEALRFWPWQQWPQELFLDGGLSRMLEIGDVLLRKQEEKTKRLVEQGHRFTTRKGMRVLVVNSRDTSDIPDAAGDVDLVVGFTYHAEPGVEVPKMNFSTRSRGDFDCGEFCKGYGGGGHKGAAGCTIPVDERDPHPYRFVKHWLDTHESLGAPAVF